MQTLLMEQEKKTYCLIYQTVFPKTFLFSKLCYILYYL